MMINATAKLRYLVAMAIDIWLADIAFFFFVSFLCLCLGVFFYIFLFTNGLQNANATKRTQYPTNVATKLYTGWS